MKRVAAFVGLALAAAMLRSHLRVRDAVARVAPELRSPFLPYTTLALSQRTLPAVRLLFKVRTRPGPDVTVAKRYVGEPSVRVLVFTPAQHAALRPAVLWIHGGGYV
ncbi:MAG: alpha/beta hydrolase, partial [Mycobacterium sp.]